MAQAQEAGPYSNPTLKEMSLDDIPKQTREGKSARVIEAFLKSGAKAAQVEDAAPHFHASLKRYVKENELDIKVITRAKVTYLVMNEDGDETQDVDADE